MSKAVSAYPRSELTVRELTYLQLAADGLTKQDIADELGICESTVKNAHSIIMLKMGADNLAHAIAMGFRRGLLR